MYFYGLSVLYTSIMIEFGWSSDVTSGASSLSRLEGGLDGPLIGWLIDQFGARKCVLFGVVSVGLVFYAMN